MDHYAQISLVLLSLTIFVLVLLCVPFFYQIWRATKSITAILQTLNQNLPAILHNLESATATMSETAASVHEQIEVFSFAAKKIQSSFCHLGNLHQAVLAHMSHPLIKVIRTTVAVFRGIKVFADVYCSAPKK